MESIEIINERLLREYGRFDNSLPNYRIVFSEDQIEKRWVSHTKEGFELLSPVVEERPKYRQYIHFKYVLERILPVPSNVETDLVENYSYEPIWIFQSSIGEALPPRWDAIKLIIENIHANAAKSIGAKYKDPELDKDVAPEIHEKRIKQLEEELFGNETEVTDALRYREGIVVPHNYNH